MDGQDFLDLSSRQEHLMREMNAYLKAIDITDSPGDNSAATMKVTNSQNKTLSSRLKVPPLATITSSSSSSSSSSSGSTDSTNKDSSTTNDTTEVEKRKKRGRRRSLTNHLNSIDEQANGSKISADCYNHIYNEGQKVIYTNAEGSCLAVITKVHYDDELQPYYTIEIEGREKQTDNNHLSRFDNESEYEYFNEANTTASSSQFEDDSLVAMAKRMDDSQTIISDPSLISCGTKEKAALLTLPNLPNITKKLGMSKGKHPPSSQEKDPPLHSDDDEDGNSNTPSDSSSSASIEEIDYNGMTREQVMSMKRGRNSPSDALIGKKEGRRSRGGPGKKKNGEKTHRSGRHRSSAEEKRTSRHHYGSTSRRRNKDRKRRQHKHDDDDEESMHGIGFNTRVNKSDIDDRKRRAAAQDERLIHQSQPRRQHHTHTKNKIDDVSSESDEHSSYDSDDCTQIFYESTDDEWCSADSEDELVAIGTSVTDAVNNLNKKRGVKSLFGLR